MTTILPPYTGETARCVKCGHRAARTVYTGAGAACGLMSRLDAVDALERLCRVCERCGYHWDEAVVAPQSPQLSREDRTVAGCSCGGLHWHAEGCTLFSLEPERALAAIADAEAVVKRHGEWLSAQLRDWQESHGG